MSNEAFLKGVSMGMALYQQKIITAHRRREPLKIGENLYYLETGRERLERVLHEICK